MITFSSPLLPKDAVTSYCGLELGDSFLGAHFKHIIPPQAVQSAEKAVQFTAEPNAGFGRELFLRDYSKEYTAPAKSPYERVRA
jgi:hypothetical protein